MRVPVRDNQTGAKQKTSESKNKYIQAKLRKRSRPRQPLCVEVDPKECSMSASPPRRTKQEMDFPWVELLPEGLSVS